MSDNMHPDDDRINGIFADLSPEDFFRETSATSTTEIEQAGGAPAFVTFVDANIQGIRESFDTRPKDEAWNPVAVLQSTSERRLYEPDDDETNTMFMSRLHRESESMNAHWFFIAQVGGVGMWADVNDYDEDPERQIVALMWYAESREPDFCKLRQGVITIKDGDVQDMGKGGIAVFGGTTNINYEGDPSGAADLFKSVLHQKVV